MNKRMTTLALLAFLLLLGACGPAATDAPAAGTGDTDALAEPVVVYRSPT